MNWAGVIAWACGALVAYFLVKIEFVGIIVGGIFYLIVEKFIPSTSRPNYKEVEKAK